MNDPQLSTFVADTLAKTLVQNLVKKSVSFAFMGSDNFANYACKVPAVYGFLHTNNTEKGIVHANHNPGFDVDEDVLWKGTFAYAVITAEYLR